MRTQLDKLSLAELSIDLADYMQSETQKYRVAFTSQPSIIAEFCLQIVPEGSMGIMQPMFSIFSVSPRFQNKCINCEETKESYQLICADNKTLKLQLEVEQIDQ